MADENKILFQLPFVFGFGRVQMIEPPFSTLFGSPKVLSVWTDVKFFGQFAPFVFAIFGSEF